MRRDSQKRPTSIRAEREHFQAFKEAARVLECDESEERFDAALRKIAAHKPPDKKPDYKQEKDKPAK